MHEIICPHCKKAFKIDEAGYADILKQVRDIEFEGLRDSPVSYISTMGGGVRHSPKNTGMREV